MRRPRATGNLIFLKTWLTSDHAASLIFYFEKNIPQLDTRTGFGCFLFFCFLHKLLYTIITIIIIIIIFIHSGESSDLSICFAQSPLCLRSEKRYTLPTPTTIDTYICFSIWFHSRISLFVYVVIHQISIASHSIFAIHSYSTFRLDRTTYIYALECMIWYCVTDHSISGAFRWTYLFDIQVTFYRMIGKTTNLRGNWKINWGME